MPNSNSPYQTQLDLLVDVLPHVSTQADFALKGGSAINLFFRDLPRLSVDIDLAWLSLSDRDVALAGISTALRNIAKRLREHDKRETQRGVIGDGALKVGRLKRNLNEGHLLEAHQGARADKRQSQAG